jgi:hypothetical protein
VWRTHPNLFYFSIGIIDQNTKITAKPKEKRFVPSRKWNVALFLLSLAVGKRTFKTPPFDGFNDSLWWENDGLVPLYSQLFPRAGLRHEPSHQVLFWSKSRDPGMLTNCLFLIVTGVWYTEIEHLDHLDLFISAKDKATQERMFRLLFETLRELP